MNPIRRSLVTSLAAAPALFVPARFAMAADPFKISHQFPAGSDTEGDFRHRLCVRFGREIDKRSSGAIKTNVYPGSSLMKVNAQFSAVRKGALDMTLMPIVYAGGEVPEVNIVSSAPLRTALNWAFTFISDEPG